MKAHHFRRLAAWLAACGAAFVGMACSTGHGAGAPQKSNADAGDAGEHSAAGQIGLRHFSFYRQFHAQQTQSSGSSGGSESEATRPAGAAFDCLPQTEAPMPSGE